MTNCIICNKPISGPRYIIVKFNDDRAKLYHGVCHITRKCTDKIPFTPSERLEMDRMNS